MNLEGGEKIVQIFCVKCRVKRDVGDDYQTVTLKNGRKAVKAKCPHCGTGMFKIGGAT